MPKIVGIVLLAVATGVAPAIGQDAPTPPVSGQDVKVWPGGPKRGETVTSRRRPEFDPVGIRVGSFFVYPDMTVTQFWDSNIFTLPNNAVDDLITVLSPQVQLRSNWTRHELNFNARADIGLYWDNNNENYEDALFQVQGRIDVARNTNIYGGFDYGRRHEDRGSPDDQFGLTPNFFEAFEPTVGAYHKFNRVSIKADGFFRYLIFKDTPAAGGLIINNGDRDRWEMRPSLRIGYEITPQYEAFIRGSGHLRQYRKTPDDNGFNRDSEGFSIVGGIALDLTGKLFGNAFVGYRYQNYDDPLLATVDGVTGGLSLTWNATGLTTFKASFVRTVEETTLTGASGFFGNIISISVDHELRRNVLLDAYFSFELDDYEGNGREDKYYRAGTHAKWLIRRFVYVSGGYEFTYRDSNFLGQSFRRHLILVKIEGQV